MGLTYAVGAGGIGIAFSTIFDPDPDLRWAVLLAVGLAGILSFVRHSLLHRADAAMYRAKVQRGEARFFETGMEGGLRAQDFVQGDLFMEPAAERANDVP